MSRQNFYKTKKHRERKQVDEDLIVETVKQVRKLHPRMGTRKLLKHLRPGWQEVGVDVASLRFSGSIRCS